MQSYCLIKHFAEEMNTPNYENRNVLERKWKNLTIECRNIKMNEGNNQAGLKYEATVLQIWVPHLLKELRAF